MGPPPGILVKECEKSEGGWHCWHRVSWSSSLHNDNEICCHCGQPKKQPRHGPHAPDRWPRQSPPYRSPYDAGSRR